MAGEFVEIGFMGEAFFGRFEGQVGKERRHPCQIQTP
jgi:hypothetical protein